MYNDYKYRISNKYLNVKDNLFENQFKLLSVVIFNTRIRHWSKFLNSIFICRENIDMFKWRMVRGKH